MAAFHDAGVSSSGGVRRAAPAQLTRMSVGTRRRSMASTIAAALSADVRSAAKPNTPPSSAQARSILADEREEMPTRAPSETNMRAQARPIPFEPPVTTTPLPRNPRSIVRLLCPHPTVAHGRRKEKDRRLPPFVSPLSPLSHLREERVGIETENPQGMRRRLPAPFKPPASLP